MSIKLMSEVWKKDFDHAEQSIALVMADHADDEGNYIYPSVALIVWKTGYEERQVRRIIARLIAKSVLILVKRRGRGRPNEYKMDLDMAGMKRPFRYTGERPDILSGNENKGKPDIPDERPDIPETLPDIGRLESVHINHHIDSPEESPKKGRSRARDPRTDHPAIQAINQIIGRNPSKDVYDPLIEILGDKPDIEKLRQCFHAWRLKHYQPDNFGWITDWYVKGIPVRENVNGRNQRGSAIHGKEAPRTIAPAGVVPPDAAEKRRELAERLRRERAGDG